MKISIVAGPVAKLQPDVHSLANLENKTVCDCLRPKERLIGENIVFHLYDRFGNMCAFPQGRTVVCTTKRVLFAETQQGSGSGAVPQLEGAAEDGTLAAESASHLRSCTFPRISVQTSLGSGAARTAVGDSDYELVFTLAETPEERMAVDDSLHGAAQLCWSTVFHFTSDELKQSSINAQKDALRPLKEQLARHAHLKSQLKGVNQGIVELQRANKEMHNLNEYMESQQELDSLVQRRKQQVQDMEGRSSQCRPSRSRSTFCRRCRPRAWTRWGWWWT